MSIGMRIKEARKEKGLSQQALAKAVGMRQPTLSALESGKTQSTSLIASFASKLGVNALWLETGRGPKYLEVSEPQSPSEDEYTLVPILDVQAACGNGYFNDQSLIEGGFALPKVMLHDLGIPEGQGRIIHAKGNSMAPTIQDGAVVLINLADKEPMMSKVYAICLPHKENPEKYVANIRHLDERKLIRGNILISVDGKASCAFPPELTADGVDFIMKDGGIRAVLEAKTIRLHDDTLAQLCAALERCQMESSQKEKLSEKLKTAPLDVLTSLVAKGLEMAIFHWK